MSDNLKNKLSIWAVFCAGGFIMGAVLALFIGFENALYLFLGYSLFSAISIFVFGKFPGGEVSTRPYLFMIHQTMHRSKIFLLKNSSKNKKETRKSFSINGFVYVFSFAIMIQFNNLKRWKERSLYDTSRNCRSHRLCRG